MKRRNHLKIERLGSCPKVSHMSTTSNYSGSQTLSSIWDIQFSIFFLNFLVRYQPFFKICICIRGASFKFKTELVRKKTWFKFHNFYVLTTFGSQCSLVNRIDRVIFYKKQIIFFFFFAPFLKASFVYHCMNFFRNSILPFP